MKRRFFGALALVLCLIMSVGTLAACDGEDTDGKDDDIFSVKYNGVTVELGEKADSLVSKLGEPKSKQNTGNCGGLGETVRYDYGSVIIVVVEYEDGDALVDQIELKSDAAETAKGIYIGSAKADVEAAYGEPDSQKQSSVTYKTDGKQLMFGFDGDTVDAITLTCQN